MEDKLHQPRTIRKGIAKEFAVRFKYFNCRTKTEASEKTRVTETNIVCLHNLEIK